MPARVAGDFDARSCKSIALVADHILYKYLVELDFLAKIIFSRISSSSIQFFTYLFRKLHLILIKCV